jgi:ribose transport system ATP-binding protein
VALDVMPGEVHGLLGQNGSGKSTLIKILAGVYEPLPGAEILMYGEAVSMPLTAAASRRRGIAFVHQRLSLIPSLSVLENVRIGSFGADVNWRLKWRSERKSVCRTFERLGSRSIPIDGSMN